MVIYFFEGLTYNLKNELKISRIDKIAGRPDTGPVVDNKTSSAYKRTLIPKKVGKQCKNRM